MKKYYWSVVFCWLAMVAAKAQTVTPVITGSPAGMYLSLGKVLPFTTGYKVYRKEDKQADWVAIGSLTPCINSAMLQQRMTHFAAVLPDCAPPSPLLADTLWGLWRSTNRERIAAVTFPLLHLALGMAFLDTTALQGNTYQYSIRFTDSLKPVETTAVLYQPATPAYAPMQLLQAVPDAHTILAEWGTTAGNAAPFFDVYRRQAGMETFDKVAAGRSMRMAGGEDSLVFMITDSSVLKGITYEYFLVAKDYLGNSGNHSDTVQVEAGGRNNVPTVFNLASRSDSDGVRLSWHLPPGVSALRNIIVIRSESYDTGYHPVALVPVNDTFYVDKSVLGGKNYFYQLITEGAKNYSIPTPRVSGMYTGAVLLQPPYQVNVAMVKNGAQLTWHYGKEKNLAGFKVYRAPSPLLQMQLVGDLVPAGDTGSFSYTDTSATGAGKTWYYAVTAVSGTSSQSPFSNVVNIAPAAAASLLPQPNGLRYLWLNDSTTSITWHDLNKEVKGVAKYRIYRLNHAQEQPDSNHIFRETTDNECTDVLAPGATRWYAVQVIDINGSESTASSLLQIEAPIKKPLPPATVRLYRSEGAVTLSWAGSTDGSVTQYQVYKAAGNGKRALLHTVPAGQQDMLCTDKEITSGQVYFYYITAVNQQGVESNQSEEISYRNE